MKKHSHTHALRHGHWFHQQLLARSLELFQDDELLQIEQELQDKLAGIQVSVFLSVFLVDIVLLTESRHVAARRRSVSDAAA